MRAFRPVFGYLRRYRAAVAIGLGSVVATNLAGSYAPVVLRDGLAVIEKATLADQSPDMERVVHFTLIYLAVMGVRCVFLWSMRFFLMGTSRRLERDLRRDYFDHLVHLDDTFFDRSRTGDLMSRATSDLEAVRMATGPAVMYLVNALTAVPLALGFMLWMDWELTLVAMAPLAMMAVGVRKVAPAIGRLSRQVQDRIGDITARVQENFSGVRVVKAYASEHRESEAVDEAQRRYIDANISLARVRGVLEGGIHGMGNVGRLLVLGYGGLTLLGVRWLGGEVDLATLVAFLAYQIQLVWPMMAFGWVLAMFQRGLASLDRIQEVMDTRPAVADPESPVAPDPARGELEVEELSFGYEPGRLALEGITFRVPAGATLGIVGPTGSGKSTLVSCLARLYPAPRGSIRLDGVPVGDLPPDLLRTLVTVVPQEPFLFSDTIAGNIALGLDEIPVERIQAAAAAAALAKDLEEFPEGLDTEVGERGVTLSGGQKQRAAIARALVRDPKVLILDDALSAVDAQTEREILSGLQGVLATRTAVIVTHRLAAVKDADTILVLEEGRIAARGTHDELLRSSPYYARTWSRQKLEAELEVLP